MLGSIHSILNTHYSSRTDLIFSVQLKWVVLKQPFIQSWISKQSVQQQVIIITFCQINNSGNLFLPIIWALSHFVDLEAYIWVAEYQNIFEFFLCFILIHDFYNKKSDWPKLWWQHDLNRVALGLGIIATSSPWTSPAKTKPQLILFAAKSCSWGLWYNWTWNLAQSDILTHGYDVTRFDVRSTKNISCWVRKY